MHRVVDIQASSSGGWAGKKKEAPRTIIVKDDEGPVQLYGASKRSFDEDQEIEGYTCY